MKLSVISIAYNNLKGLKKTLEIFEKNSFQNEIELVIVDGGSNDGSKEFLENQKISKNWVSEPDKGIYNAMNKGIEMAKGDYLWFLNSGDFAFNEDAVQQLLKQLEKSPDAVYAETMMVDEDGNELGTRSQISTRKLPDNLNWKSLKFGMNVSHQSFVIKKEKCLKYNEQYRHVADIDWMIACLKRCHKILKMDGVLACFAMDGHSSKHRKVSNQERYQVLNKHYGTINNAWNHAYILFRKILNHKKH
jgi:glycosyltransferase involved in cell wall biosynthesis